MSTVTRLYPWYPEGTELSAKSRAVKSWLCSCGIRFVADSVKVDGRTNRVICTHEDTQSSPVL